MRRLAFALYPLTLGLVFAAVPDRGMVEWPNYAGDQAGTHFSPLTDINRSNVSTLSVAWAWKTGETALPQFHTQPGSFENTPLMIDNVLYVSTPYNRVVALDAESGHERWSYDPHAYEDGQPPNGTGFVHRGVAAWRDHGKLRIFINSRARLICLDADTGKPVESFGAGGSVNLVEGLRWAVDPKQYTNTSPPVIYKDLVIVGNGVGDRLAYTRDPLGDVRAYDARTGRVAWTFHTVAQAGETGNDTWGGDSWKFTGHTNVWAPMSLDERRGLLYLPVSTPSNDFYGARRPGKNLFADSIVCLDAASGARRWSFQTVHHGLWDYDLPAAPILVTVSHNGHQMDAVAQLTKTGFVFVFDRVTGKPLWPVEERPVPASDVPGEQAWPTQPFPTKPAPLEAQGVTEDDAFDATPALHAAALEQLRKLRMGPLFTPPSLQGTVQRPGVIGGANWGGGAFDPHTGRLYVKTSNEAHIARLVKPDRSPDNPRAAEVDADLVVGGAMNADFDKGIPLLKPPYAHLTAVDLSTGEFAWRVPFGDMPSLRENPALKGAALPNVLGAPGAPGTIVTAGGLLFVGGGDAALHAVDAATGKDVWTAALPRRSSATPMTYRAKDGRQYVVIAVSGRGDAELVAFALPQ